MINEFNFFRNNIHYSHNLIVLCQKKALKLFLVFLLQSPVFFIVSPAYLEELLTFLVSP